MVFGWRGRCLSLCSCLLFPGFCLLFSREWARSARAQNSPGSDSHSHTFGSLSPLADCAMGPTGHRCVAARGTTIPTTRASRLATTITRTTIGTTMVFGWRGRCISLGGACRQCVPSTDHTPRPKRDSAVAPRPAVRRRANTESLGPLWYRHKRGNVGAGHLSCRLSRVHTYRGLYPQLCSFENLYHAYRAARQGKRGTAPVALPVALARIMAEMCPAGSADHLAPSRPTSQRRWKI